MNKKTILLKLSGELFSNQNAEYANFIPKLILQIKKLKDTCNICFVIGGGNFLRGKRDNKNLNLPQSTADEIGMLATLVNGRMLQALLENANIKAKLLSALPCPNLAEPIGQHKIDEYLNADYSIVFVGGTGNPYFSTDTNSVIRTLQINAYELWKATKVDGIYSDDPLKNPTAKLFKKISYKEVLDKELKIMDLTAITLAKENQLKIRVFNLFEEDSLLKAFENPNFGSLVE